MPEKKWRDEMKILLYQAIVILSDLTLGSI